MRFHSEKLKVIVMQCILVTSHIVIVFSKRYLWQFWNDFKPICMDFIWCTFRNIEFGNYRISYADPDTGEQES